MDVQDFAGWMFGVMSVAAAMVLAVAVIVLPMIGRHARLLVVLFLIMVLFFWSANVVQGGNTSDRVALWGFMLLGAGLTWALVIAPLLMWGYSRLTNRPERWLDVGDSPEFLD
jgi:hypothetical protein